MNKMRYVQNKISPPWLSPAEIEALQLAVANRPHAASLKEQLIKQERKGGLIWNWHQNSKNGK